MDEAITILQKLFQQSFDHSDRCWKKWSEAAGSADADEKALWEEHRYARGVEFAYGTALRKLIAAKEAARVPDVWRQLVG